MGGCARPAVGQAVGFRPEVGALLPLPISITIALTITVAITIPRDCPSACPSYPLIHPFTPLCTSFRNRAYPFARLLWPGVRGNAAEHATAVTVAAKGKMERYPPSRTYPFPAPVAISSIIRFPIKALEFDHFGTISSF